MSMRDLFFSSDSWMCGKSNNELKFWTRVADVCKFKHWLNLSAAAMKLLSLSDGLAYRLYFGSSGSYEAIYC